MRASIGRLGEVPNQRITLDMVSICEELTGAAGDIPGKSPPGFDSDTSESM
jgi:hypothetical protein